MEDNNAWLLSASGSPPYFFDFLTNQTLTKHETSSNQSILNPSCSFTPFLSINYLTPQSTVGVRGSKINALLGQKCLGGCLVSEAHQKKCINSERYSHNHLPRRPTFFCRFCPPAGTSAELFRPSCHNVVGMERECHSTHTHTPFPPLPSALSTTTTKDHTHTPDLSMWTNHARAHGSGLSVPP